MSQFLDAENGFIRQVAPAKTQATLRWNAASSAYLTLPDNHAIIPTLAGEEGVRCAVWMVTIDGGTLTKRRLLRGRVGTLAGEDAPYGTVRVPVVDDWGDLSTLLGWQVPGAAIGSQGGAEYARYTGTSEDNAKAAIAANVARLGRPWDVAPSLGRGNPDTAPLELRMHTLGESVVEPLITDRLQLTLEHDDLTGRSLVDVREGEVFPRPITPQSGVLSRWSWVKQPPTATRAVVGGRGEGTARQFALVIDTALEAELGVALEIYVDARNAEEGADLAPYGWAELAKHRGKAGLTATLRETSWFRFADGYELGDKVRVQVGALDVEDVISQVDITHDTAGGFVVVPKVGLATEDPTERLVGFVKNVATAVRGLEKR
ncbi:Gp37-like protein [Microbacterium trichothecenolyticum]